MLTRLDDGRDTDAVLAALEADGAVLIDHFVPTDVTDAINREIDADVGAAEAGMLAVNPTVQMFFGPQTKHVSALAATSPTFANTVMTHPTYRAVCDAVLLPSCSRWQLNLGHAIVRGPGAEAQWPHRDEDVWPHYPRPSAGTRPEIQVASMVALTPFRPETGATRVVPGSHRWPRERRPEAHEIAVAELPLGGAVLYYGSTIHFAGANTTADEWRRGVHVSFTLGWLRTEENNFLAVPPEIVATLSPEAQELLGYAVHDAIADGGGYLGMVRMRDPRELLGEGALGR
jgi:ectoine hydroxylase-related dioxygenase (phytanoyl-CoA dioxygenase family)